MSPNLSPLCSPGAERAFSAPGTRLFRLPGANTGLSAPGGSLATGLGQEMPGGSGSRTGMGRKTGLFCTPMLVETGFGVREWAVLHPDRVGRERSGAR